MSFVHLRRTKSCFPVQPCGRNLQLGFKIVHRDNYSEGPRIISGNRHRQREVPAVPTTRQSPSWYRSERRRQAHHARGNSSSSSRGSFPLTTANSISRYSFFQGRRTSTIDARNCHGDRPRRGACSKRPLCRLGCSWGRGSSAYPSPGVGSPQGLGGLLIGSICVDLFFFIFFPFSQLCVLYFT